MAGREKSYEALMTAALRPGAVLLAPLVVHDSQVPAEARSRRADARITVGLPGEAPAYCFVVESKRRATPQEVQLAVAEARAAADDDELPMILVPYLSPERLAELERQEVSGVDLSGNGIVLVPGRLLVLRSGQPNKYRDSRPLSNPYRGRSAMVARLLLTRPRWESLKELTAGIEKAGTKLAPSQVSKAIRALEEELVVATKSRVITLQDPARLLDGLADSWRPPVARARRTVRLPEGASWWRPLSSSNSVAWAVTGESSAPRYVTFAQAGPTRLAVSSIETAFALLGGAPESVPNFADVELIETDEAGYFFDCQIDERGARWASPLQTWLELQSGDARQRDASEDLRATILEGAKR
jgi:hypothetical protein